MIKQIDISEAKRFYRRHKEPHDQLSFSEKGTFVGYYEKSVLCGIVGTLKMGKAIRIKTLSVRPDKRGKGIATELLKFIIYPGIQYTAFASTYSYRLFVDAGFKEMSEKANGIKYMKREAA